MDLIKVAVIAGTPVDTMMGADFLKEKGMDAVCFPISENPIKQTEFQVSSDYEKERVIKEIIDKARRDGIDRILVFCNSLSGSMDMDKISKEENIPIITPMNVYREIAKDHKKLGVIAANSQGLSGIEKALVGSNPECIVLGVGMLPLVLDVESKKNPVDIIKDNGLEMVMELFKINNAERVILGCTHFPYFGHELAKHTDIEIIDPSEEMYRMLCECVK